MKWYYCTCYLFVLNMVTPVISLGGDASPGMATQGIIRVPQSGMVTNTFGAPRMPNLGMLKKPYKPPIVRERQRHDISTTKSSKGQKAKSVSKYPIIE